MVRRLAVRIVTLIVSFYIVLAAFRLTILTTVDTQQSSTVQENVRFQNKNLSRLMKDSLIETTETVTKFNGTELVSATGVQISAVEQRASRQSSTRETPNTALTSIPPLPPKLRNTFNQETYQSVLQTEAYRRNSTRHPEIRYLIENSELCQETKNLSSVIVIYTAIDNFSRRRAIRETWASSENLRNNNMKVVFLIGRTHSADDNDLLASEIKEHSDFVQGDFLDTYRNLTYKGLLAYKWVSDHCSTTKAVVKVDDDVFLNLKKLNDIVSNENQFSSKHMECQLRQPGSSPILRNGRWKIPDSVFPGLSHYPINYCNGIFVIISPDLITSLYQAAREAYYLWVDDVYLFGVLTDLVGGVTFKNVIEYEDFKSQNMVLCLMEQKCDKLMTFVTSDKTMRMIWTLYS